ncbi:MAG: phosphatase PAP2 family protein [Candidatus Dojkabacteria bacterium]|nr:phosphatase PAP2 family protein [Candidatus Dojkabacteria bacterium]
MPKKKIARIISELFNGFLTMLIVPIIAVIAMPINIVYKIIIPILYIVLPLGVFFVLKKLGKASDYEFTKREERPLYFSILSLIFFFLFLLCIFIIKNQKLTDVSAILFLVSTILTIVSMYWKMSGHMTYSTFMFFSLIYLFPDVKILPILFIFTPFIGWSRVALGKHDWLQVVAGTVISALISVLFFWIL